MDLVAIYMRKKELVAIPVALCRNWKRPNASVTPFPEVLRSPELKLAVTAST